MSDGGGRKEPLDDRPAWVRELPTVRVLVVCPSHETGVGVLDLLSGARRARVDVQWARRSPEAVTRLRDRAVDIVLVDGTLGLAACRALRDAARAARRPPALVLMTRSAEPHPIEAILGASLTARWIRPPRDRWRVDDALESALASAREARPPGAGPEGAAGPPPAE
jgi:CheY-like chemotaxis protein